jgi:hypothetical protein
VFIFVDPVLCALGHYSEKCDSISLIEKTIFKSSAIDFMLIAPLPNSMSGEFVHVMYVKDRRVDELLKKTLPEEFTIRIL